MLSEIETVPGPGTLQWAPVRRYFGVAAFGLNAYVAHEPGQDVVERHTEQVRQHEEMYVVVAGSATFTLDDDEIEAPPGTVVFVRGPAVERSAVASERGTVVVAVGARPGTPYEPGPWEPVCVARCRASEGGSDATLVST